MKRFLNITGISIIALGLVVTIFLVANPYLLSMMFNLSKLTQNNDVKEFAEYDGIEYDRVRSGEFIYTGYGEADYQTKGAKVKSSKEYGMESWTVGKDTFSVKRSVTDIYTQGLYRNNKELVRKIAYDSTGVGATVMGDVVVEYDLSSDPVEFVAVGENVLYTEREDGRVSKEYWNEDNIHEVKYSASGEILSETVGEEEVVSAKKRGASAEKIVDELTSSVTFDYLYKDKRYLSSWKEGNNEYSLSYINDRVCAVSKNGVMAAEYILDGDLRYWGIITGGKTYYFVYGTDGNVFSVIDENGEPYAFYIALADGSYYAASEHLDLVTINGVVDPGMFMIPSMGVMCGADKVLLPADEIAITVSGANVFSETDYELVRDKEALSKVLAVNDIPAMNIIKAKVRDNVCYDLQSKGIYSVTNAALLNEFDEMTDYADIYTLAFEDSDLSLGNLLYGNQIYRVAYNDHGEQKELEENRRMLSENIGNMRASYLDATFEDSSQITAGTLSFSGQFKILGYLVSYDCYGDGIVFFSLEEVVPENYRTYVNIYDYDTASYLNYVECTFNVENFLADATTAIPGFSTTVYEEVADHLLSVKALAGSVTQDELRYYDETFYKSTSYSAYGDTLDNIDLTEEDYLVIGEDGNIKVEILPFYTNPRFLRNVAITAAVIVVVAVIVIVTPGGCVMAPIAAGALKGALSGVGSAMVFTAVKAAKTDSLKELNRVLVESSDDLLKKVGSGIAMGAAFGALQAGWSKFTHRNSIVSYKDINKDFLPTEQLESGFVTNGYYYENHWDNPWLNTYDWDKRVDIVNYTPWYAKGRSYFYTETNEYMFESVHNLYLQSDPDIVYKLFGATARKVTMEKMGLTLGNAFNYIKEQFD